MNNLSEKRAVSKPQKRMTCGDSLGGGRKARP